MKLALAETPKTGFIATRPIKSIMPISFFSYYVFSLSDSTGIRDSFFLLLPLRTEVHDVKYILLIQNMIYEEDLYKSRFSIQLGEQKVFPFLKLFCLKIQSRTIKK